MQGVTYENDVGMQCSIQSMRSSKGCDGVMQCAIGLQRVSVHAQHMGLVCKLLITLALT